MGKIIAVCIFVLSISSGLCFAQSNQTASLTVTTYYPAPIGVYNRVRLTGSSVTPGDDCTNEGELRYNGTSHEAYVCKGSGTTKWKPIGSGMKYQHGIVSPATCNGVFCDTLTICNTTFYQDIPFAESFSNKPDVMVSARQIPDLSHRHPCSNGTDKIIAYTDKSLITTTGFRVYASGSPTKTECSGSTADRSNMTRALVTWFAVGQ